MSAGEKKSVTVLLLAGDRSTDDPVSVAAGTVCKAIAPLAGRPMILRVLAALDSLSLIDKYILCGPPQVAIEQVAQLQAFLQRPDVHYVKNLPQPGQSVDAGLALSPATEKVLVTTADNALLEAEMIQHFLGRCQATEADFCIGMVSYAVIKAEHPQVKRTVLKFRDAQYCGCNLYYINTAAGREVISYWKAIQQDRKQPWRMLVKLFGVVTLLRYLAGLLSVSAACAALQKKTGLSIQIIDMPFANAGIDVDTVADRDLVEQILGTKK